MSSFRPEDYIPPGLATFGGVLPLILVLIKKQLPSWARTLGCVIWVCIMWVCFYAIMLYANYWAYSDVATIIFLVFAILSGGAALVFYRRKRKGASANYTPLLYYLLLLSSVTAAATNSKALRGNSFFVVRSNRPVENVEFKPWIERVPKATWFGYGQWLAGEVSEDCEVTVYERGRDLQGPFPVKDTKRGHFSDGQVYELDIRK